MPKDRLQTNALHSLSRTLDDLSSFDRQRKYKQAVPFVHVPIELLTQWEGHYRRFQDATWFRELFSPAERKLIDSFNETVEKFWETTGSEIPDVDAVFDQPDWSTFSNRAKQLLGSLSATVNRVD